MFATAANKSRNATPTRTPTQPRNRVPATTRSGSLGRTPRTAITTAAAHSIAAALTSAANQPTAQKSPPNNRSKFTERKTSGPLLPQRTRSLRFDNTTGPSSSRKASGGQNAIRSVSNTGPAAIVARRTVANKAPTNSNNTSGATGLVAQGTRPRIWNRNAATKEVNNKANEHQKNDKLEKSHLCEMGIQTNEFEILNKDLLIGDIKLMLPSRMLVAEIDRNRMDAQKKALLKAQRKFEEHSEKQEEHLNDLKEFLEKAAITRRPKKTQRDTLEYDRKLINTMDEILNRRIPKTESITDIKGRIKKKEKELLGLFDNVENMNMFGGKN